MIKKIKTLCVISTFCLLTACATLKYESPEEVDLSGSWVLDPAHSQEVVFSNNSRAKKPKGGGEGKGRRGGGGGTAKRGPRDDDERSSNQDGERSKPKGKPEAAIATEMTIQQASDSMGIMYKSGHYRDVEWGKTEQRKQTTTAGWQEDSLVIKTEGGRSTMTETYSFNEAGDRLIVLFEVNGNKYYRIYEPALETIPASATTGAGAS